MDLEKQVHLLQFFFFLYVPRREAAKGNKNQTIKPTEVPFPGKVQIHEPKEWDKCVDTSLLKQFKS